MALTEKQLERQREYRRNNGNAVTKRYEKTKKGKLMRTYRNMESRVAGIQWKKEHLYKGKELLSRDEFYDWSIDNPDFNKLFNDWVNSDYDRKLSPSIDRIDVNSGYVIGNIRWITHSENSRLGAISRNKKH